MPTGEFGDGTGGCCGGPAIGGGFATHPTSSALCVQPHWPSLCRSHAADA